ncbi:SusC/RagA family TonB-linked outer membrane protein [Rufibacter aurantiacus]|uniref:SusC/RagA family TonB-linked outer membrane protein n=1 Tax=Rufibacter aurantiacus TaxID=2817374 RepID=UPI001B3028D8|nr:TonB-dependent receptor [Rufibacter aurantiacus]
MKKHVLLFLFLLNVLGFSAMAQNRTISGRVTSATDGSALPGVSVVVKGTTIGASTDVEGRYQISVTGSPTLVFTFIGFTTREIAAGTSTTIDVKLAEDTKTIEEVVVVGYGSQEKREVTGSIASIKSEDIQRTPTPSFENALQGRTSGVLVEQQNGKLGQGIKVRVRGSSSVSAGNEPLYVLDGVPLTTSVPNAGGAPTNPLVDLNPNDIASIEVLKDAAAAAIYGSRAANGVVLITTKKGTTGGTKVNVSYFTGFSKPTNKREFLNSSEYVELLREAAANSEEREGEPFWVEFNEGRLQRYAAGNADPLTYNTDWQDEVFQDASVNQIDVSVSGGNEKTKFYTGLSNSNQDGILINNRFEKISGRLNLDHQINEKVAIGMNFSLTRTKNFRLSNDNAFSTPMQIVALPPITPVTDPRTGLVSGALDPATGRPNTNYPVYYNPLLNAVDADFLTTVFRNFTNLYASYKILPGLTFRSEFGLDLLNQNENAYYGRLTARNIGTPNGIGVNAQTQIFNYNTNNFFNYNKSFTDAHNVDVVLGMSYQESNQTANYIEGQQFPSNAYRTLASAADITEGNSSGTDYSFLSYFTRVNYKFKDRYLLGLSGRIDGSSRFGNDSKYGFFPAASVGWILSEESFLANSSLINYLKLRGSYGITGNAEIANAASLGLYSGDAGYGGTPGQRPTQIENPELKWEETAQLDVGLEYGFWNGRLSGEIDYYVKKTDDLLLNVNVPGTSGYRTQLKNVGKLQNKGFEFSLNSDNLVGDFKWSTNFNYSRNRNKITDLQGQIIEGGYLNRAVEGQPIGVFFGVEYAGVDPDNGDALYYLNTLNTDGSRNRETTSDYGSAERVVIGDPNPDFVLGLTNNFSFKGFDLSVLFQGVVGNDIYNGAGTYMSASASWYDNQTKDQLRRWQKPGDITDVPRAYLGYANGTDASSRYLSDGSYMRLKNVTLGYTLPTSFVQKFHLEKVRVYAIGLNLLTFTDYEGWDPEVNTDYLAGNISQGNDFYGAPQARTITFGVNIGF